jgi:hypothetical protein
MSKAVWVLLASFFGLLSMQATAEESLVRIDQAAVKAAGGFPYKITQPGSYRLTSNLVVPATANGIMVTASNVVLDLNGFSISCAGNQLAGITEDPASATSFTNVQVRHGTVTGCGTGVYLASTFSSDIEDLTVSNYTKVGIQLSVGQVRRSTLLGNGVLGSVSLFLQGGIVESNHLIGDNFGISGGVGSLLITGNVIEASMTALILTSDATMISNNVLRSPGSGVSRAVSPGNNLCTFQIC